MSLSGHRSLASELAVALARAVADDQPYIAVLVFADDGLLLAATDLPPVTPRVVVDSCGWLLKLLTDERLTLGPVIVVSVRADFDAATATAKFPALRARFDAYHCSLVDWLLVADGQEVVGVPVQA